MKNHHGFNCPIDWNSVPDQFNWFAMCFYKLNKDEYLLIGIGSRNLPYVEPYGNESEVVWECDEKNYWKFTTTDMFTINDFAYKISGSDPVNFKPDFYLSLLVISTGKLIWQRPNA